MQSRTVAQCRTCQEEARWTREAQQSGEERRDDPLKERREALRRAERCRYFIHERLNTPDGKENPRSGQRTCSLTVLCGCGHEERVYNLCVD